MSPVLRKQRQGDLHESEAIKPIRSTEWTSQTALETLSPNKPRWEGALLLGQRESSRVLGKHPSLRVAVVTSITNKTVTHFLSCHS